MRTLLFSLLLACEPPATWTPASGSTTPLSASGAPVDGQRPYLYLDRAPAAYRETGHIEVHQQGLGVVGLATLLSSLRKEAAQRGCEGVLVRTSDWIPEGQDNGRVGVFVSLYIHGELCINGLRAACIQLQN